MSSRVTPNGGMIFVGSLFSCMWVAALALCAYRIRILVREGNEFTVNRVYLTIKLVVLGNTVLWILTSIFLTSFFWFATTASLQVNVVNTVVTDSVFRPISIVGYAYLCSSQLASLVVNASLHQRCATAASATKERVWRHVQGSRAAASAAAVEGAADAGGTAPAALAEAPRAPSPPQALPSAATTPSAFPDPSPLAPGVALYTGAGSDSAHRRLPSGLSQTTKTSGGGIQGYSGQVPGAGAGPAGGGGASFGGNDFAAGRLGPGGGAERSGAGAATAGNPSMGGVAFSDASSEIDGGIVSGLRIPPPGGSAMSEGGAAGAAEALPEPHRLTRLWQQSLQNALMYLNGVRPDISEDEAWEVTARWALILGTRTHFFMLLMLLAVNIGLAITAGVLFSNNCDDPANEIPDVLSCFTMVAPGHLVIVRSRIFDGMALLYDGIYIAMWGYGGGRLYSMMPHERTALLTRRRVLTFGGILLAMWLWRLVLMFNPLRRGPVVGFGQFVSEVIDGAAAIHIAVSIGTASGKQWGSSILGFVARLPLPRCLVRMLLPPSQSEPTFGANS